jgi:hypothetical protein
MSGPLMIAAAASAHRAQAERAIMDAFRLADATHADRARPLEQVGVTPTDVLDQLRGAGLIREAEPRRFYLDEAAVVARRMAASRPSRKTRIWLLAVVIALHVLLGLLIFFLRPRA